MFTPTLYHYRSQKCSLISLCIVITPTPFILIRKANAVGAKNRALTTAVVIELKVQQKKIPIVRDATSPSEWERWVSR